MRLKDWTKFEKAFAALGTIAAVALTFIFKGEIVNLTYTLMHFWTALLLVKGKYACYIIGLISTFFYAYISFSNQYYGETIIAMCLTLPMMVFGLINWLKHQDKKKTVIVKKVSLKELFILILSQIVLSVAYYYLLKSFNTSNLIISTANVAIAFIASYLAARRSDYGFIAYIINDLMLVILWGTLLLGGNIGVITVLLCPVLLLITDIYGVINWQKIKKRQAKKK
ncbi:nicotinamide mononucleotide transporter [Candidatus Saccharibacteria bacterium]|nr:nicotinamide mononucleotide transporter [Candidatus Saccharibacteria bacterium]